MTAEAVCCPHCGVLWRSQAAQELILEDRRCPACREPMDLPVPIAPRRHAGLDGAVDVLDEAPARLEEAGFLDEAALLDRTFEALRAQAQQAVRKSRAARDRAERTRQRLVAQRDSLRWTVRSLARRDALDGRQRRLLAEINDELRRTDRLLEHDR